MCKKEEFSFRLLFFDFKPIANRKYVILLKLWSIIAARGMRVYYIFLYKHNAVVCPANS